MLGPVKSVLVEQTFSSRVTSVTRLNSLGSIKVSLHLKAHSPPHASQGPQQLSPIQLIYIEHYCKLHHQDLLALKHVSTMAVQSSLGDSLINLCNTLSLTSLESSIFP